MAITQFLEIEFCFPQQFKIHYSEIENYFVSPIQFRLKSKKFPVHFQSLNQLLIFAQEFEFYIWTTFFPEQDSYFPQARVVLTQEHFENLNSMKSLSF